MQHDGLMLPRMLRAAIGKVVFYGDSIVRRRVLGLTWDELHRTC